MKDEHGTITASSELNENVVANELNWPGGVWYSSLNNDQWLKFQFKKRVAFNGFRVKPNGYNRMIQDYKLEKSEDGGKTWKVIKTGTIPRPTSGEWIEVPFDQSTSAHLFRLFIINNWGDSTFISMRELQLSFVTSLPGK